MSTDFLVCRENVELNAPRARKQQQTTTVIS